MLDLRLAARNLRKNPGFTIVAMLTLALGVGANTAIFSVVKAVLINPLPYRDADRLVAIAESVGDMPRPVTVDYTTTHDLRERSKSFESMSLYRGAAGALVENDTPELLNGLRVNYDFFQTLGVTMAAGRAFTAEEDRAATRFELILTHALWVRRFGADPNIIGRVLHLSEAPFTVVGILPEKFSTMINAGTNPEFFIPLGYDLGGPSSCRTCAHLRLIGKLKAGVTPAQASAELVTILQQIKREYPDSYHPAQTVKVTPEREQLLGSVTTALWILLAAVGLVLLIACVNVANLLLARATARSKEIALRVALGAARGRIVRQLLVESGLLALLGGAAGIALAWAGTSAFTHLAPKEIPRMNEIRMDAVVLLFSLVASLVTGVLFGLVPALRASRVDLGEAMKGSGKSTGSGPGSRMRNVLAMAELALAFVLVVGAGLLLKSFARLTNVNPGYDSHPVLTLSSYIYGSRYAGKPDAEIALYDRVMETLRATPGVESAAMVSTLPLAGFDRRGFHIQDRPLAAVSGAPMADSYSITTDYFQVMRIPLKRGRAFTSQDRQGAPLVAIISETAAKSMWPAEDAIGKHIQLGGRDDTKPWATIVGVVGDIRQYGLDRAPGMEAYLPLAQNTNFGYQMVIRGTGDPKQLESAARAAFAAADKTQPIFNVQPLDDYLKSTLAQRTFTMALLAMFGALAIGLAAVGIYGVISYAVSLRTREVGIRMALGARRQDVLAMILRQGLALTGAGLLVGFLASLALTRFLRSLLFEVSTVDLETSALVAICLTAVALAASLLPARRAMNVDPTVALRQE